MLQKAHGLGLKVIVDLVPNHTSDEHVWFQEALAAAPGSRERDRYMFRPGKDSVPGSGDGDLAPNNWKSIFGGPAWTRVTEADGRPGDWYLHLFDTKQPDLNWENAEVREEMRSVLRFWLDRGVDGFRVDVAHGMVKEAGLPGLGGLRGHGGRGQPSCPAKPTAATPKRRNRTAPTCAGNGAAAQQPTRHGSGARRRGSGTSRSRRCIRRRRSLTRTACTTSTATGTGCWPTTTATACWWPRPGWSRPSGWPGMSGRMKCSRRSTSTSCWPAGMPRGRPWPSRIHSAPPPRWEPPPPGCSATTTPSGTPPASG